MSGGGTISSSATKLEALQLQSSTRGACIPWVRGLTRLAGNLLWYGAFKAIRHTESQGGKGGEVRSTNYTYSASVMMSICHGPIASVPTVWRGKRTYTGGITAAQVKTSLETWTVPGSGAMTYTVTHGATFLAVLSIAETVMSDGGLNLLVKDLDYTVSSAGLVTVLNEIYRGFTLSIRYQWSSGSVASTALSQLGLSLLPGHVGQPAWSGLASFPAESLGYSGLAVVAAEDYDLGEGASIENHSFEVAAPGAYQLGETTPDCDPAYVLRELLTDDVAGASLPAEYMGNWQAWSDYCVAAGLLVSVRLTKQSTAADLLKLAAELTSSAIVTSSGRIELVPYADQPEAGYGRSYTPVTTPVYDLTDSDYLVSRGSAPLRWRLKSGGDAYNHWRLDYANRANGYNVDPVEAKDRADIAQNGLRTSPTPVDATDWICDGAAARKAVQLRMQRSISVLSEYEATLPWHYALLEPADLVTLADVALQLDRLPARVVSISEDAGGDLQMVFEDAPIGTASTPTYSHPPEVGFSPDHNASPGSVSSAVVFEGPAQLAPPTGIEVYIAARGASASWGGCHVWTSLTGSDYRLVDTIRGPSRFGTLAAAMTSGATSMQVTGLADAELLSGSTADAQQLQTLCFVAGAQGEFVAHAGATLTGVGAYTLAGLVRAAYASPAAAHSSGAAFVRVDDRCGRSGPLEPSMIGQTLYIKLTSFNVYGGAEQALSDVSAITYTVTGQPASYMPGIAGKALAVQASALTFQYPAAGGVAPASITFTALRKGGLSGAVTWSVVAGTATLTGSGDSRSLAAAGLTTDTATIRATITDSVGTYSEDVTVVKVRDGAAGADAPLLVLQATSQTFTFDGMNVAQPTSQTITFTAALQAVAGTATWTATGYDAAGTSLGAITLGGSGNTRTMAIAAFGAASYAVITASLAGLSDSTTIVRLRDGAANIAADLSNDAHTLPATADGTVTSFTGAVTTMSVYVGLVDDSANWTFARNNSTGVSSTRSGNVVTVTGMTAAVDSGYVDITATRAGYPTQTRRFVLAKAKSAPGVGGGIVPNLRSVWEVQETGFGATANVSHTVNRNGTRSGTEAYYLNGSSTVGDGYYVRLRRLSGTSPSGPALATWHQINTARTWSLSATNAQLSFEGVEDISTAGSDATIVATGSVSLTANSYTGSIP